MTRFRDRVAAPMVALAIVVASTPAIADGDAGAPTGHDRDDAYLFRLGEHFYDGGMYYRAIGSFEELALVTDDETTRIQARLRIAMSYHHGGQLEEAVAAYDVALASAALSDPYSGWVRLQRSLARVDRALTAPKQEPADVIAAELTPLMSDPEAPYATLAGFHVARIRLLAGDRTGAAEARATIGQWCQARPVDDCAVLDQFDRAIARDAPRRRSPWLAITLSTVLPGLGSAYSQHYVDGLYYLGITSLSALGAWDIHDPDRRFRDQQVSFYGLGALAIATYAASLIQAYVGARRFNSVEQVRWRGRVLRDTERGLPLDARPLPGQAR